MAADPMMIRIQSSISWRTEPMKARMNENSMANIMALGAPPGLTSMVLHAPPGLTAMRAGVPPGLSAYLRPPPGLDSELRPLRAAGKELESDVKGTDDPYDCESTTCGSAPSEDQASVDSSPDELESSLLESLSALDRFSLAERAHLILPTLAESAQLMGLRTSGDSISQLQRLIVEHPESHKRNDFLEFVSDAENQSLKMTLKGLGWQELLRRMCDGVAPPSVEIAAQTLGCEMQLEWAKVQQRKQQLKKKRGSKGKKLATASKSKAVQNI
jgi:hypothetical protein